MLGFGNSSLTIGPCDELDMDGKEKKKRQKTRMIPVSLALLSGWLEVSCPETSNSEI